MNIYSSIIIPYSHTLLTLSYSFTSIYFLLFTNHLFSFLPMIILPSIVFKYKKQKCIIPR